MKNKTILISVIVCTYNRAELLKDCLKSLESQAIDKNYYEVVIVNNNSTDNTQRVAKEFIKNNTNFRIVKEKTQGGSYARNRGWRKAKGKYVAYIDDDAVAPTNWVKQIMVFIENNPKVNAFGGPYERFSTQPIPDWFPENWGILNLGNRVKELNLTTEWISGSNIIFNKLLFNEYGGFNTDLGAKGDKIIYGDETEFLIRLKKTEEAVFYVPTIRVRHLVDERKLHLWWLLKNDYWQGFSYSLFKKNRLNFFRGLFYFISGLFMFPLCVFNSKKNPFKRRVYFGLSKFFSSLGRIFGSFRGIKLWRIISVI